MVGKPRDRGRVPNDCFDLVVGVDAKTKAATFTRNESKRSEFNSFALCDFVREATVPNKDEEREKRTPKDLT